MRKILTFLALFVIGLALPYSAKAYYLSYGANDASWVFDQNLGAYGGYKDIEVTSNAYDIYFYIHNSACSGNFDTLRGNNNIYYNGSASTNYVITIGDLNTSEYQLHQYGSFDKGSAEDYGVCQIKNKGVGTYRIQFNSGNMLKVTFTPKTVDPATISTVQIYTCNRDNTKVGDFTKGADGWTWSGEIKKNDTAGNWDERYFIRFTYSDNSQKSYYVPAYKDTGMPKDTWNTLTSTTAAGGNGDYFRFKEGDCTCDITIKLDGSQIKYTPTGEVITPGIYPKEVYLYGLPSWTQAGTLQYANVSDVANGIYKWTNIGVNAGATFRFSEEGKNWGNGKSYCAAAKDTPITSTDNVTVIDKKEENQNWKIATPGAYDITLDLKNNTVTIVRRSGEYIVDAFLPLTPKDFKDASGNPVKHYFLVGQRMGKWHLQPEWEFTVSGNTATLPGRFYYDSYIGIAVVDNYNDYANHTYTLYSGTYEFKSDQTSASLSAQSGAKIIGKGYKGDGNLGGNLKSSFNGWGQNYWDGNGKYVTTTTLTLSDGVPTELSMTPATDDVQSANRVFTLVGSGIYNMTFGNQSGSVAKTPRYNAGFVGTATGWQEGWIQYDPVTNKPYVDGNGEYLYLTSFTPDVLSSQKVQFHTKVNGDQDFTYNSDKITFIEASKLSDLDKDPYKEFYKSVPNIADRVINTGVHLYDGTDENDVTDGTYNYTIQVSDIHKTASEASPWRCYVIRDMWMAGQFKFWSGWGGNVNRDGGSNNDDATFHGPNGGPVGSVGDRTEISSSDVTTNTVAKFFNTVKNVNDNNFMIPGDVWNNDTDKQSTSASKAHYYNRVILWYNINGGVDDAFMQFIRESVGPAIFAWAVDNGMTGDDYKKNFIDYNWYIDQSENDTDEDIEVLGYKIIRYRYNGNDRVQIGYPEGDYVSLEGENNGGNFKVKDLYDGAEATKELRTFHDTGVTPGEGFAPGLYAYDIIVTYKGKEGNTYTKKAVSNDVPIYGDATLVPENVPMQLIELRDNYYYKYDTEKENEVTGGKTILGTDKQYLTYRTSADDNWYLFNLDADDKPVNISMLTAEQKVTALDMINNHQEAYYWTSSYYVRCLNQKTYDDEIDRMSVRDIKEGTTPELTLEVTEVIRLRDADGNPTGETATTNIVKPVQFEVDADNAYWGAVVRRLGNLADGTFNVVLKLDYVQPDDTEKHHVATKRSEFDPVIPRPFNPVYRYVYERSDESVTDDAAKYGKITVPLKSWEGKDIFNSDRAEAYVKASEVKSHKLTLEVDFNRPNVNDQIWKYYDIHYNLRVENNSDVRPVDITADVHDVTVEHRNVPNMYRFQLKDVHPSDKVFPIVTIDNVVYKVNKPGDESKVAYQTQAANFGMEQIHFTAGRKSVLNDGSIFAVRLGKVKRPDGTWDWMYKGHKDFKDTEDAIDPDGEYPYLDPKSNGIALLPTFYLIESRIGEEYHMYNYLVPHHADHQADINPDEVWPITGFVKGDSDPLIGTYIIRGAKSETTPEVNITGMYIFERNINPADPANAMGFNDLEVVDIKYNHATKAAKANARAAARPTDDASDRDIYKNMGVDGVGELPDVGVKPAAADIIDLDADTKGNGVSDYVAVRGGRTQKTPDDQTVTGVDDVLYDGNADGSAAWYNLQGVRIEEPASAGVYIRVIGKTAEKVVIQ